MMTIQQMQTRLAASIEYFRDKFAELKSSITAAQPLVDLGMNLPAFMAGEVNKLERVEAHIAAEPDKGFSDRIEAAGNHAVNMRRQLERAEVGVLTLQSTYRDVREQVSRIDAHRAGPARAALLAFRLAAESKSANADELRISYLGLLSQIEIANSVSVAERIASTMTPPPAKHRKGKVRRYVGIGERRSENRELSKKGGSKKEKAKR